jgi:hypothetical protein
MKGLQDMLKNEGSPLSVNDGQGYNVAGRSAADMASVNGTIHNQYSTTNNPEGSAITPSWLGQFGATINSIPQPTSVGLSGTGTIDGTKYLDNLPI